MKNYSANSVNRATTVQSLESALKLLTTDDDKDFRLNYFLATHDNSGKGTWTLIYKRRKK